MLLTVFLTQISGKAYAWPTIKPESKAVFVEDANDPSRASLEMTIYAKEGSSLYNLTCHSGDYESTDPNYSGILQCFLFKRVKEDKGDDLLNSSRLSTRSWDSRARFLKIQLEPKCSEYPDWGTVRHFQLRDMD